MDRLVHAPYGFFGREVSSFMKARHHLHSGCAYNDAFPHATDTDASIHLPCQIPSSSVKTLQPML